MTKVHERERLVTASSATGVYLLPYQSKQEFERACNKRFEGFREELRDLALGWIERGLENSWIREAVDPPFSILSLQICSTVQDLTQKILQGNWCLGQAFAYDELCFINQVNGGDEWLTIKGDAAFESITMQTVQETREEAAERLRKNLADLFAASPEECKKLRWKAAHIREKNDRLRKSLTGHIAFSRFVANMGEDESSCFKSVLTAVTEFDSFDEDDDPYGEHDFGAVEVEAETYFFKFDYYDAKYCEWSDSYDESTVHLMTIMRADEY